MAISYTDHDWPGEFVIITRALTAPFFDIRSHSHRKLLVLRSYFGVDIHCQSDRIFDSKEL